LRSGRAGACPHSPAGEFAEEADPAEHRPDSVHLPHHPLNRFVAGVRIGREKQMLYRTVEFARRVDGIDSITNGY
jgi:hypothetical protein